MEANTEFYRVKFYGQKDIFFCLGYTYKLLIYYYTQYILWTQNILRNLKAQSHLSFLTLPPPICSLKLSYKG